MTVPFAGQPARWRIAIVDDDRDVLRSLSRMLTVCGYDATGYPSAGAFLLALDESRPDILLVDLQMPDTDGLSLQATLREVGYRIPIVFLSGHGDVPTSVRAIRGGAIDFLEKPCDETTLLAAIERAIDVARAVREKEVTLHDLVLRWRSLTHREREVCRWVVTGRLNKQIAKELGTAEKTVKVHRGRVMAKMQAASLADLVRMFDALGELSAATMRTPPRGMLRQELHAPR